MGRNVIAIFLVGALAFGAGCASPGEMSAPASDASFMTTYGCEITPSCSGEDGDPSPDAPGYWMGSVVSPAQCFSETGIGINDSDRDGMDDICEHYIADRFRPSLVLSDHDCNVGREPYWAAKYFPRSYNTVRVIYLLSYYVDCGVPDENTWVNVGCGLIQAVGQLGTFNGRFPPWNIGIVPINEENLCEGHNGDSEFIVVDIRFDSTTSHWVNFRTYFSAHWMTAEDRSRWRVMDRLEFPDQRMGGYPRVYVAQGKHGNYPTRRDCNDDGGRADDCSSGNLARETRVRMSRGFNVGSAQVNFLGSGTCVGGGALYSTYPELYGTECYWVEGRRFQGWVRDRLPDTRDYEIFTSTPYRTILVMAFECYLSSVRDDSWSCDDWGVTR